MWGALLREVSRNDWQEAALEADSFSQAPEALLALVQSMHSPFVKDPDCIVSRNLELLRTHRGSDDLLALLPTMQRTLVEDCGVKFGA